MWFLKRIDLSWGANTFYTAYSLQDDSTTKHEICSFCLPQGHKYTAPVLGMFAGLGFCFAEALHSTCNRQLTLWVKKEMSLLCRAPSDGCSSCWSDTPQYAETPEQTLLHPPCPGLSVGLKTIHSTLRMLSTRLSNSRCFCNATVAVYNTSCIWFMCHKLFTQQSHSCV